MVYTYDYRSAGLKPKLPDNIRRQANQALIRKGFGGKARFTKIGQALNVAFKVLGDFGIEPDTTLNADLFRGDNGHRGLDIAWSNPEDSFSPMSIQNSMLALQWTKMDNGQYEIIAYLS